MFLFPLRLFIILSLAIWPFGGNANVKPPEIAALSLPENPNQFKYIRILLAKNITQSEIEIKVPYQVYDGEGRSVMRGASIPKTTVIPFENGIKLGGQILRGTPITFEAKGAEVFIDGKPFRHAITFFVQKDTLMVVNEVLLEDYLKGVLPWEANPKWKLEALKAQAIASRTYAFFQMLKRVNQPYDVSNTVMSQVYKGKRIEEPNTARAIKETRGQILVYEDKVFATYFHSTSGGTTTRADYVWNYKSHPSLMGTKTEFSYESKHFRWENRFKRQDIEEKLRAKGIEVSGIESIAAVDIDASGRARNFEIKYTEGKVKVHSNQFRIWMDPGKFKSTLITWITREGDEFTFKGKGWGHGVGLCQYSAKKMAELGYNHRQILEYFYGGSRITQYWV